MTKKQLPFDQRGYRYYDGTDDDDGDFLLIKKENLEKLPDIAVSGNSNFNDLKDIHDLDFKSKIPKGKYYVVRIMETREY